MYSSTTNRNASVLIGNLSTTHQHRGQRMYLKDKVVIVKYHQKPGCNTYPKYIIKNGKLFGLSLNK